MVSVVTTEQWVSRTLRTFPQRTGRGWMGAVVRAPGCSLEYMCELDSSYTARLGIGYVQRLPEQDALHHASAAVRTAVVEERADRNHSFKGHALGGDPQRDCGLTGNALYVSRWDLLLKKPLTA